MYDVGSIASWVLKRVMVLDEAEPGFAGAFLRSSVERRQVMSAYLAEDVRRAALMGDDVATAHFLRSAGHDAILGAAVGEVPAGYRSALRRAGGHAHQSGFYRYLHALLASPPHTPLRRAIGDLKEVSALRLQIARLLPAAICRGRLVELIRDRVEGRRIATAFELLVHNGIPEQELAAAIRRVDTREQLGAVWRRWSLKTIFPPHPIAASEAYRPVATAGELRRLGLRFANCASNYTHNVLDGDAAFAEFSAGGERGVVHLRRIDEIWCLDDIHARRNGPVDRSLRLAAIEHLAQHGIRPRVRRTKVSNWDALRRLTSTWDYDDEG